MEDDGLSVNTEGTQAGTQVGTESALTTYAGPYVTEMMGKGAALADTPYEAYEGPLTAGASDLQTTAFEGIGSLNIPTDTMGTYAPTEFTAEAAQGLMNPYLMAALNPQLEEARRQSDIERQRSAGRLLQAGAFGGGRQAVMAAENQRNLLQNLAGITGEGYRDAYDKAMGQFNVQQDRALDAATKRDRFGLDALDMQLSAGETQRDIEQQGITADQLQFIEEKMFPYKQVQFMQSLLQGLPLETQAYTYSQPTGYEQLTGDAGKLIELFEEFAKQYPDAFGSGDSPPDLSGDSLNEGQSGVGAGTYT